MSLTYYVALPFVQHETGIAPGQAQECPNEPSAIRRPKRCLARSQMSERSRSSAAAILTSANMVMQPS